MPSPSSNDNRNITRAVTYDSTGAVKASGWMVRFTRSGKSYQSFFGDHKHGGQRKSLAAARLDRDAQEPKFEKLARAVARERLQKLLAGGGKKVPGVRYVKKTIVKGKGKAKHELVYDVVVTQWLDDKGKRRTASFSCDKYGKRKAYEMACEAKASALKKRLK